MADSSEALNEAERAFLGALNASEVRYLIVGMSAALLQGVRGATEDIDLWFADLGDSRIAESARAAGGFLVTRSQPPLLGGAFGDRFDIVTHMSGLPSFDREYADARLVHLEGLVLRLLPLERILCSKRTANRPKDALAIARIEQTLRVLAAIDAGES